LRPEILVDLLGLVIPRRYAFAKSGTVNSRN
jgi:hypothetical protein